MSRVTRYDWMTDDEVARLPTETELEEVLRLRLVKALDTVESKIREIGDLEQDLTEAGL